MVCDGSGGRVGVGWGSDGVRCGCGVRNQRPWQCRIYNRRTGAEKKGSRETDKQFCLLRPLTSHTRTSCPRAAKGAAQAFTTHKHAGTDTHSKANKQSHTYTAPRTANSTAEGFLTQTRGNGHTNQINRKLITTTNTHIRTDIYNTHAPTAETLTNKHSQCTRAQNTYTQSAAHTYA